MTDYSEEEWEVIPLGDAATFINGYAFKPADWSKQGLEIIRIQNLTKGSSKINYFEGEIKDRYKVRQGDFLISWSATLGIYEWKDNDAWLNQHLFKVVFDKKAFDRNFFRHLVSRSLDAMGRETHGSTMKHITKPRFDSFKIPYPPLAEQQKIAEILDAADALRQKDQQLIDHYTALSQSLFSDMFGDPVVNPKGWIFSALIEVIKTGPQNGLYKPSKDYGEGTPIIRIDSFHNDIVRIGDLKRVNVSDSEISSFKITEGDFVINRVNSPSHLGKCGLVPKLSENTVFESNMMRVTFDEKLVNNSYMLWILSSQFMKRQILNSSKDAVNQSSINQKDVNSFNIPLPPIELQNQFAERIAIIEKQKQQAQASLEQSNNLFNSLLQKAFTGELTQKQAQVA